MYILKCDLLPSPAGWSWTLQEGRKMLVYVWNIFDLCA